MDPISQIIVPAVIIYIMTVVGLSLTPADLGRVARSPRIIIVATIVQVTLLPLAAVGLAVLLKPPAALGLGMLVYAACPPAAMANFYIDLAGWNTALSVTLTAVGNLLAPFLLPIMLAAAIGLGLQDAVSATISIPLMMGQIILTMIVPLALGMGARRRWPAPSERALPALRLVSLAGMLLVAGLVAYGGADALRTEAAWLLGLSFVFTLTALGVGYVTGLFLHRSRSDLLTLAIDFAIRNAGIAIFVTTSVLGSVEAAVFVVGVLVVHLPLVLLLIAVFGQRTSAGASADPS